jgi:hypothetical protein
MYRAVNYKKVSKDTAYEKKCTCINKWAIPEKSATGRRRSFSLSKLRATSPIISSIRVEYKAIHNNSFH